MTDPAKLTLEAHVVIHDLLSPAMLAFEYVVNSTEPSWAPKSLSILRAWQAGCRLLTMDDDPDGDTIETPMPGCPKCDAYIAEVAELEALKARVVAARAAREAVERVGKAMEGTG